MTAEPVFIVGMGRSGSSLLWSLINEGTGGGLAPEIHFLDRYYNDWAQTDLSNAGVRQAFWDDFGSSFHFERLQLTSEVRTRLREETSFSGLHKSVLYAYSAVTGGGIIGEKTPAYYRQLDTLLSWYPGARVVYLVRDPRGFVLSHRYVDEPWAKASTYELARRWRRIARHAGRWVADEQVLIVRYEDLVQSQDALRRVEQHCRLVAGSLDRPPGLAAGARPESAGRIVADRVDAWKMELATSDLALIELCAGRSAGTLGYPQATTLTQRLCATPRLAPATLREGSRRLRAIGVRLRRWRRGHQAFS